MSRSVRVVGLGEVEIAAYGFNDAEHRVEKEISNLWPDAAVTIAAVRRADGPARIVDEFIVSYRVEATLSVTEVSSDAAMREAFRRAREYFQGTRYRHMELRAPAAKTD